MNNSCLAHVINLTTWVLISTYSKLPHFDPKQPDAYVLMYHNEVGLVRAIVVKVCTDMLLRKVISYSVARNAHHQSERRCGKLFKVEKMTHLCFNLYST